MTGKIMQQNLLKNAIAASLILVGKPCGKSSCMVCGLGVLIMRSAKL
jgi:hypothetical protein